MNLLSAVTVDKMADCIYDRGISTYTELVTI
jgi:hypothetical protein